MSNEKSNTKDHADFQSSYNQSKNFSNTIKEDALEPVGEGDVKVTSKNTLTETDKEKIAVAMDKMHERIEMTPGGEQSDISEEE